MDTHVHPIQYQLDSNGVPEIHQYAILVKTPAGNETTAIRSVLVRWQRQVSPAPQSATFGDVPTNHQFFQFIEALSDSGITAGCQANPPLFCPDRTLTRGEMAVFLAKHWGSTGPGTRRKAKKEQRRFAMRGRVSALIFAVVFPALAGAQAPEAAEDFGTDEGITVIGYTEFLPSQGVYTYRNAFGGRYLDGGPGAGGSLLRR